MLVIVDYGAGNVKAIENMVKKAGGVAVISSDPAQVEKADKLILPGVGSFDYCAMQLRTRKLIPALETAVFVARKPVLGLCVGAQLMLGRSEEGTAEGLGWIKGQNVRFEESKVPVVPHMGWSNVTFEKDSQIAEGLTEDARFYFVHSYHFVVEDRSEILATASYEYPFACAFQRQNIFGVQFHPEKSHRFGMRLFQNFIAL